MFDNGVNKRCSPSPTLFTLYINELETCLDKINGDSPCSFNTMVTILLYDDNVVLLSKSWACLQRIMNKLYEVCTSSSPNFKLSMTIVMIFGCNKRTLNQEAFHLSKNQIEIIHEYKYLGIDFYAHGYFEPSSKKWQIAGMRALMATLRKETVVGVNIENPNLINSRLWCFQISHMTLSLARWFGRSQWKVFRKRHKDTFDVSRQSAFFNNLPYFAGRIWRTSHDIMCF